MERACAHCGSPVRTTKADARFCSRNCKELAKDRREALRKRAARPASTCQHCAVRYTSLGNARKFCSQDCNKAAHARPKKVWTYYKSRDPRQQLLLSARSRAKRRGLPFDITVDDIEIPERCPVLGVALKRGKGKLWAHSPSLDRVVPAKGYVRGNVCVISVRANTIKNDASAAELAAVLDYVRHMETN
jgi:predicted nucleic acid-binding Zn ribbon protein